MIKLVVNADDLGLHPSIDEGIFRAKRDGIVTSATVLVRSRNAPEAVKRARSEGLALGVHLCLSTGFPSAAPADEVPTVAPGGRMRRDWSDFVRAWALRQVCVEEVERELRAQVAIARELGAEPDHLDGHQHLHVLPGVSQVVQRIARDEKLPLRWPSELPRGGWLRTPAAAAKTGLLTALARAQRPKDVALLKGAGVFETNRMSEGALVALLERLADGAAYDLCTHPGLNPDELPEDPTWRYGRESELQAMCSEAAKEVVRRRGIALTTYREVVA